MIKTTIGLGIGILLALYLLILVFLYFKQEALLFPAEKLPSNFTFDIDYPFEEVFIPVSGGEKIHALHIKSIRRINAMY